jgi:hypothetical protein
VDQRVGAGARAGDRRAHRKRSRAGRVQSAGETRTYATEQAPLKRVRFRAGDKVRTREDQEFVIKEVIEQQGLLIYVGENQRLPEAQLSDRLSLRGPQERLFAGRFDTSARLSCAAARWSCSTARASRRCADSSAAALT